MKAQFPTKFELPPRPDIIYREQSVEDYSDLLADNDSVFDNKPNLVLKVGRRYTKNTFLRLFFLFYSDLIRSSSNLYIA